uniref:Uncharacterized protein n=1 Tax=Glossina brevipalpis TaxID=37001 RepID=A0A1A9X1E7_9MUSC
MVVISWGMAGGMAAAAATATAPTAAAAAGCKFAAWAGVSWVTTAPFVVIAAAVTEFCMAFSVASATIRDSCGGVVLKQILVVFREAAVHRHATQMEDTVNVHCNGNNLINDIEN